MARLRFRPPANPGGELEPGEHALPVVDGRGGLLYVADTAEAPAPVMLFFHGAGGTGRREMRVWLAAADRFGAVVIAPDSRGPTWDVIHGGFGPDVDYIDRALEVVASAYAVNWTDAAIGGVSDGASYALSLGIANGDVFGSIVAFSPGFIVASEAAGTPRVWVSHGTADPILPIDGCSRPIVAGLAESGYHVTFCEFDGGHTVPPPVADRGFGWWLSGGQPGVPEGS